MSTKQVTEEEKQELLETLENRFKKNMQRHEGITWEAVAVRLQENPEAVWSLHEMERTGGEPDVVGYDSRTDSYHFYDCVKESPKGRRSCCYDQEAREGRKKFPPETSAVEMAQETGVQLLNEEQYRYLQTLGEFDLKTSSWIVAPDDIRALGGALFGDRRYNTVFTYHNGADSYYASRGWRGILVV
ncbi:DUF4256 domain-containing protein [Chryseomicrobium palamuruense]|uniref:DUF4256 domain-containing protein n=1 Tax=Chryseomicrobium palamuruense TaxID=682973 RepID=A0ABV8UYE2_9BACL